MIDAIKTSTKDRMEKAMAALSGELKKVRTGRAQVSMLDSIRVDYYGNPTPLNQVASISCPDAKSFLIAPWETNLLKDIEGSIIRSDVGMTPQNDGKVIRLKLPDLTEERRKDLVKTIKKIVEDARVAVRMARRDANEAIKKAQKDKEISEDDQKKGTDEIQKLTDDYIKQVDQIGVDKEKDLMTL
ncbi:MAG: ribosome recycling factor [Pseudobdellovibrionaceae bacterium]|nr:ribosome recycling factor [Bdellovibrionales bacterium]USN46758.1 MAG: ribosome recycling factor [Pseudobdellovibrionaceae bacterium]